MQDVIGPSEICSFSLASSGRLAKLTLMTVVQKANQDISFAEYFPRNPETGEKRSEKVPPHSSAPCKGMVRKILDDGGLCIVPACLLALRMASSTPLRASTDAVLSAF